MGECRLCRHWFAHPKMPKGVGQCRANPPVPLVVGVMQHPVTGQPQPVINGFFPETPADSFCGRCESKLELPLGAIDLAKLQIEELQ